MRRLTDEKLYLTVTTPLDGEKRKFFLVELEGHEQISGLFHYKLKLKADDSDIDFSLIVGESVTINIEMNNGTKRYINGTVFRFIQAGNDGRFTNYYAEVRPWLWELTQTSNSKIFQNQTVPDIIADVFSDLGFTDFDDRTGTYAQRGYCVQYQETAFEFVSRLMEDEGIFYFFEHTQDSHTLILADDTDAHQACPGLDAARMRKVGPEDDDLIDRCTLEQQMIPNKYAAEDFNFETPDTDLLTSVDGKEQGSMRLYEYPGGFTTTDDGETKANKRIEIHELPQKLIRGEGFCRAFIAGYKFDLTDHDREDMNSTYVLKSLSVLATQERYTNVFDAFPDDVPFRPPRTTKKPKIFGTQTAIVVGKSGEEIWPDEYGRVKVQFHWDQDGTSDENSSCWIRVAQVWAGKSWGTLFIPRMDTEVIVSFLEGDPDLPIIIGTVYNATQTVPYTLPDDKNKSTIKTISTKSGTAGNEIRFDDTKDAEELYIHAQKDKNVIVENDRTTQILNDETLTVTKNRVITIKEENETLTVEQGDRTITVGTGNETHEVAGTRSLTVTGNETHTNEADFTQEVTGNYTLEVSGNLTIDVSGSVTIKSGSSFTNQSGSSLTNKASTSITNKAGTSMTNKAGTSMTNKASLSLTNKAGASLTNKAGASLTNKGSASQTVDGGGSLTLKGGMVSIG